MTVLSEEEINEKLRALEGWQLKGKEIHKVYTHKTFKDAIAFVNKVADLAERANHHPDFLIQYNKVTLTLSTHSKGGVTESDIKLAKQIEEAK
ncbi:MAG: 4a-hydroxytetrahydrobiopterin dehydratase [Candidatus Dadabacteria bacterium]